MSSPAAADLSATEHARLRSRLSSRLSSKIILLVRQLKSPTMNAEELFVALAIKHAQERDDLLAQRNTAVTQAGANAAAVQAQYITNRRQMLNGPHKNERAALAAQIMLAMQSEHGLAGLEGPIRQLEEALDEWIAYIDDEMQPEGEGEGAGADGAAPAAQ
jgi:hypothetical protein